MKYKKLSLGISFFAISVFLVFLFLFQNTKTFSNETTYSDKFELKFANNFISYVINDQESMSFNLFAIQEVTNKNYSLEKLVSSIEFNNPKIKITDFEVDTGIKHKGYKLINIIVNVEVLTNEIEEANTLLIQFNNEDVRPYEMGKIIVQSNRNFEKEGRHIEPFGEYTVGYPSLLLDVVLKNTTSGYISPIEISDLSRGIFYQFHDDFKFPPKENKQVKINDFNKKDNAVYDFMTISPILSYTIDNDTKVYNYNMPGVIYNILDPDIEKMEKMVE